MTNAAVLPFGWLFKRNHQEHDFGIDGQIEVVTETGVVTGQMLACQIKCGKSFFKETNPWGLVYRGETKHSNYLANYPIPVIVILCDPDSKEAYWARFTLTEAQITEAGWKLTVPFAQKLASSKEVVETLLPPIADHHSLLKKYWEIHNLFLRMGSVLLLVDKEMIEEMDLVPILNFLQRVRSSRELALHCKGRIGFLFHGYDSDSRELFEIDDVRKYIAALDREFHELFFFVALEEPAATFRTFLFCLMGGRWTGERATPGTPQPIVVDFSTMPDFLPRHFYGLNRMCEWLGLPDVENKRISDAVGKLVGYEESSSTVGE
jgi:hypothetical protein